MVCLYAKDACNCTICAGFYYSYEDSGVLAKAVYYHADDFSQWANGDIAEPNGVDISANWFSQNID